jgi:hypothetical protein
MSEHMQNVYEKPKQISDWVSVLDLYYGYAKESIMNGMDVNDAVQQAFDCFMRL